MRFEHPSLRQGLVGAWCPSLGASGLSLIDRSGRGNHSVLTNMAGQDNWRASGSGVALNFDGTNDYVSIPLVEPLASLQVPMTISAWCYKAAGASGSVFTQYRLTTGSQLIKLAAYGTGEFAYYASTAAGGFQRVAYSSVPPLNTWHCLTWVVQGTLSQPVCRLGLNGVEQSFSLTALSTTPDVSVPVIVAARAVSGGGAAENNSIIIDDLRIYNRALTLAEIRLLSSRRGIGLTPLPDRAAGLPRKLSVNVGGDWRAADSYINVGGTWKLGQASVNVAGVWK